MTITWGDVVRAIARRIFQEAAMLFWIVAIVVVIVVGVMSVPDGPEGGEGC